MRSTETAGRVRPPPSGAVWCGREATRSNTAAPRAEGAAAGARRGCGKQDRTRFSSLRSEGRNVSPRCRPSLPLRPAAELQCFVLPHLNGDLGFSASVVRCRRPADRRHVQGAECCWLVMSAFGDPGVGSSRNRSSRRCTASRSPETAAFSSSASRSSCSRRR